MKNMNNNTTKLSAYAERYEIIMQTDFSSTLAKDIELSHLMSDMEQRYSIPMLRDPQFEDHHPDVMKLYLQISLTRILDQ